MRAFARTLRLRDAFLLAGLFVVQFAIPVPRVPVWLGWGYLALALGYAAAQERAIRAADVLGTLRPVHLVRRVRARRGARPPRP